MFIEVAVGPLWVSDIATGFHFFIVMHSEGGICFEGKAGGGGGGGGGGRGGWSRIDYNLPCTGD